MFNVGAERPKKKDCFLRTILFVKFFVTFLRIKITAYGLIQYKNTVTTLITPVNYYVSQQFIPVTKISTNIVLRALTTNFHILVSRGGGWLGISRTIKF